MEKAAGREQRKEESRMTESRAVLYTRVSSREQEQEGFSLDAQTKLLREYADRNGLRIEREFQDVETAKISGRKQFSEMVAHFRRSRNCRVLVVEKTDRLYRNFRDALTLEDLDIEIHFVKEGQILSRDSKSQVKLMHDIRLAIARNYSENLKEEVRKGMAEKAAQGTYPARAPFGYRNDSVSRRIEAHPAHAQIVRFMYERYATGNESVASLQQNVRRTYGKRLARSYVHTVLTNRFYLGIFEWDSKTYVGTHPPLVSSRLFENVQAAIRGHNKGKYRKHDIAFRGMLACAHDHCTVTAEVKKGKYVYYRCSGGRGPCDLPRFREQEIAERLGTVLQDVYVPEEAARAIVDSLRREQASANRENVQARARLERERESIQRKMDQAYSDRLEGTITEEFWKRRSAEWHEDDVRISAHLAELRTAPNPEAVLTVERTLELANRAYFLYLTRKPAEQAELLKKVLLNCAIDGANLYPTYRKPFDLICKRVKNQEWSGRADLNCRPLAPQASALPG
jgi:site-specific DNA recombinase